MSWVRRAVSIALFVATFGTMAAAILGVIDPLFMLIAWAALFVYGVGGIEQHTRRMSRPAPAGPVRPDADVAQYLNDDDRKWLGEFAPDWTDPRPAHVVAAEGERKIAEQATKLAQARSWENGTGFVQELDAARPEPTSRVTAVCLCLYDPNGDREYRCRGCAAGFGSDRASRNVGWDIIEIRDALSGRAVRRESTGR